MRLVSFDNRYKPRNLVKGQVLVDFVAKFAPVEKSLSGVYNIVIQPWRVFIGGASNARGVGIGIVIMSPEGVKLEHCLRLGFQASNNEAKYEVLIAGLKAIKKTRGERCRDLFRFLIGGESSLCKF